MDRHTHRVGSWVESGRVEGCVCEKEKEKEKEKERAREREREKQELIVDHQRGQTNR